MGGVRERPLAMIGSGRIRYYTYEDVKVNIGETSSLGHNDTTEGSRGTFSSGMAAIFAARKAVDVLKERAAKMWQNSG